MPSHRFTSASPLRGLGARSALVAMLLASGILGQAGRVQSHDLTPVETRSALAAIDALCAPPLSPKAMAFTLRRYDARLDASGRKQLVATPWQLRYLRREGVGDRVEYLDAKGTSIPAPPGLPAEVALDEHRAVWLAAARGYAGLLKRRSFVERYSDCRGRRLEEQLATKTSISLLLEPRGESSMVQTRIFLKPNGLPWRNERRYRDGRRVEQFETWEDRGGKAVLTKLHHREAHPDPAQPVRTWSYAHSYQRVQGRRVLASVEQLGKGLPLSQRGKVEFLSVAFDERVPSFEVRTAPKPPEPAPKPSEGGG